MIDKHEAIFDYGHILRKESPGIPSSCCWRPRPVMCLVCHVEFTATSPIQKRCKPCQKVAKDQQIKKAQEKKKAQRKAARSLSPVSGSTEHSGVTGTRESVRP